MAVISKHRNDEIVLLERYDSPYIFCRLKIPNGGWLQKSTKCKNIDDALLKAEKWHNEMTFLHEHGLSVKRRTFAAMCDLYIDEFENDVKLGLKNARNLKDYRKIIDSYLRPYFGRRYIDQIKNKDIAEYQTWRMAYWITGDGAKDKFITYKRNGKTIKRPKPKGKLPSYTTQNRENVVLRAIFRTALKNDILTEIQIPTITINKKQNNKKNRRPAFTREEYDKLTDFLFEWPNEKYCKNKERRWLLRNYVIFLAHSGLRPGTETDNLCWKHLRQIETTRGEKRFVLTVDGKTGIRNPVVSDVAHAALTQIKIDIETAGTEIKPDMPVFCLPDGTPVKNDYFRQLFHKALKKSGLLKDASNQQRSLYSLRHTYATFQLLYKKVSIYTLKEQMGTSIRMIELYYGHLTPELAVDELTDKSIDNFIFDDWLKSVKRTFKI